MNFDLNLNLQTKFKTIVPQMKTIGNYIKGTNTTTGEGGGGIFPSLVIFLSITYKKREKL